VKICALAIAVTAVATTMVTACGYRPGGGPTDAPSTSEPARFAAAASVNSAPEPTAPADALPGYAVSPPNAEGDPPCPVSHAWGKAPSGVGILVSYWSDDTSSVTVLVRTTTGIDRSQRASLGPDELRLFEFPDIDKTTVREVLIMTNTRRCFATPDPAALGS
jgi:hypothetical protein